MRSAILLCATSSKNHTMNICTTPGRLIGYLGIIENYILCIIIQRHPMRNRGSEKLRIKRCCWVCLIFIIINLAFWLKIMRKDAMGLSRREKIHPPVTKNSIKKSKLRGRINRCFNLWSMLNPPLAAKRSGTNIFSSTWKWKRNWWVMSIRKNSIWRSLRKDFQGRSKESCRNWIKNNKK